MGPDGTKSLARAKIDATPWLGQSNGGDGQTMTKTSSWTALQNPVFRTLWGASLLSGICVAAHDTAATWLMNTLTPSPLLISVMSTVASLPFFLLTLPAGALAGALKN